MEPRILNWTRKRAAERGHSVVDAGLAKHLNIPTRWCNGCGNTPAYNRIGWSDCPC